MSVNYLSCFCMANVKELPSNPQWQYKLALNYNNFTSDIDTRTDDSDEYSSHYMFLLESSYPIFIRETQVPASSFSDLSFPEGIQLGMAIQICTWDKYHGMNVSYCDDCGIYEEGEIYSWHSWTTPKVSRDYHFAFGAKATIDKTSSGSGNAFVTGTVNMLAPESDNPYKDYIHFTGFDSGSPRELRAVTLKPRWAQAPQSRSKVFLNEQKNATTYYVKDSSNYYDLEDTFRNVYYRNAVNARNPTNGVYFNRNESYRIIENNNPAFDSFEDWWDTCIALETQRT